MRVLLCTAALFLAAGSAGAVDFANVVSLGDSALAVGAELGRAPVVSDHVAQRLGAHHTILASDGTTTASMLADGQHTQAAAQFGPGDLAFIWVGAEDILDNQIAITLGIYSSLNGMEANLDIAVSTLRTAGLEVVILALPDLSLTPVVQRKAPQFTWANFQTASRRWRNRIEDVAALHGAIVVDMYDLSQLLDTAPEPFTLYGVPPVPAPERGDISACPSCVYFDNAHPSAVTQGFVANEAIALLNAAFDPGGAMSIEPLSRLELFNLTQPVPVPIGPASVVLLTMALFVGGAFRLRHAA